jgi:hypothetical protein
MSVQELFNFDSDNIGDFLSDPLGSFKKIINSFYDGTGIFSSDQFLAVALTNGVEIDAEEATLLGYPAGGDEVRQQTFYKFKARTIAKDSPHVVLTDPCTLTDKVTSDEKCLRNALIAAHSTVVYSTNSGQVNVGNIVTVKFSRNSDDTLNLRQGNLVNFIDPNRDFESLTPEACEFIESVFELGDSYAPPPPIVINSEIFQLAEEYDRSNNIRFKRKNNTFIKDLLKPFDSYVKAFIMESKNLYDIDINIYSGVRTKSHQQQLYNDYVKNGKKGPAPAKPSGNTFTSLHQVGLAIDFNFYKDGKLYMSQLSDSPITGRPFPRDDKGKITTAGIQQHKREWINTGIFNVIDRLGLRWGGNFRNNYDPIHVDLPYGKLGLTKNGVFTSFKTNRGLDTYTTGAGDVKEIGYNQALNETTEENILNSVKDKLDSGKTVSFDEAEQARFAVEAAEAEAAAAASYSTDPSARDALAPFLEDAPIDPFTGVVDDGTEAVE